MIRSTCGCDVSSCLSVESEGNLYLKIFKSKSSFCIYNSSYLAQEIFAYKLKSQTTRNENDASSAKNVHFRIQSIMLHDFQSHFWYLIIVTIVCTFAVFDRIECPPRFAFLSTAL